MTSTKPPSSDNSESTPTQIDQPNFLDNFLDDLLSSCDRTNLPPIPDDCPTRDWLFRKSNGCIFNVNLELKDHCGNPDKLRKFSLECHTVSYGKYIAWYCEVDLQHNKYEHPFRYLKEEDLEKNDQSSSVVCGYVYDNEVSRQILRHLAMTDDELRQHISSYTTTMEYRARFIKCLKNLVD